MGIGAYDKKGNPCESTRLFLSFASNFKIISSFILN